MASVKCQHNLPENEKTIPFSQANPAISEHHRHIAVLCHVLAGHADQVEWASFSPSDWERLGKVAQVHGVAPLLYDTLNTTGWPEQVPGSLRSVLQAAYYRTTARNTVLYQELGHILVALQQAEIPVVVLKGAALACTLYPEIGLRPMVDIDVLVRHQDVERAIGCVRHLGYRSLFSGRYPVGLHVALKEGPYQIVVEFHWTLISSAQNRRTPSVEWFWEQTEWWPGWDNWNGDSNAAERIKPSVAVHAPRCLTPVAHLLYLATHLVAQHGGEGAQLLWFYDLHLAVGQWGTALDWDELLAQAHRLRKESALSTALQITHRYFDTPAIPPQILTAQSRVRPGYLTTPRVAYAWNMLAGLEWPSHVHFLFSIVFPSRAYLRWRYHLTWLPSWLWPLYYPYRWMDLVTGTLAALVKLVPQGRRR
jgi:hypothetical protein